MSKYLAPTLIVLGIGIILLSTYQIYRIVTSPGSFNIHYISQHGISVSVSPSASSPSTSQQILVQSEILSEDSTNKLLNLGVGLLVFGFISSAGYKLSSLGTKLLNSHPGSSSTPPPAN